MMAQQRGDVPAKGGYISFSKVVDLSWPIHPGIPQWPGDPPVEFKTVADFKDDGYLLRHFSMGEHSGTHLSAPSSFQDGAPGHEEFSPEDLVRPAVVIDIATQAEADPDYALTMNDILDWESGHGPVPQRCVVLLRTGWQTRWSNPPDYLGGTRAGHLHFPGFGLDASQMLLDGRNIAGLGTDTAGAEPGADNGFFVSRLALENRLIVLENLTNLDLLPPTGTVLVVGLLRLEGGSGCPASVTALVP